MNIVYGKICKILWMYLGLNYNFVTHNELVNNLQLD